MVTQAWARARPPAPRAGTVSAHAGPTATRRPEAAWAHVFQLWHHVGMTRMGIRELRDSLPAAIRQVRAGLSIEVTDHGHPVARLVPIHVRSAYEQLVVEGRIVPAEADLLDFKPLPVPPGMPTLSEILAEMRADER